MEVAQTGVAYEQYDYQVDADGSFRLRSGNSKQVKGGQLPTPTKALDMSMEYNAEMGTFFIRVGESGAPNTVLTLGGLTSSSSFADLKTNGAATVECKNATITAQQTATINATTVVINTTKNVEVNCANAAISAKKLIALAAPTVSVLCSKMSVTGVVEAPAFETGSA
jgi:hypothetical protein